MGMRVSGTFIADNGIAANIAIGFIPDYIEAIADLGDAELIYRWYRCLADAAATGQHGIADDGAGALTPCTGADDGFAAYDEDKDMAVLIESPIPGKGLVKASVLNWASATASVARTATTIGTVVRPLTTKTGYVYECTTTGTGHTVEPTWPTTIGETVTEGAGSGVWTCREENLIKGGGMGFTVGKDISTDSDIWVFRAERHDRMGDMGDAADADPLSF